MFTGIVEDIASVEEIKTEGTNIHFWLSCAFTHELKIDQSVSHNGVCLTVVKIDGNKYCVTAVDETLSRTNLGSWKVGHKVNVERAMKLGGRLDGHLVQGHVDTTANCTQVDEQDGSWKIFFEFDQTPTQVTIEKGSICVNGVSLTVVDSNPNGFSIAVIPYTYEHTNLGQLKAGDKVNIEFDMIGKYVEKLVGASS